MVKQVLASVAVVVLLCVFAAILVSPPVPAVAQDAGQPVAHVSRWQIHRADMAISSEADDPARAATNTILLDSFTGETWLLWPAGDAQPGYAWFKLERKGE